MIGINLREEYDGSKKQSIVSMHTNVCGQGRHNRILGFIWSDKSYHFQCQLDNL